MGMGPRRPAPGPLNWRILVHMLKNCPTSFKEIVAFLTYSGDFRPEFQFHSTPISTIFLNSGNSHLFPKKASGLTPNIIENGRHASHHGYEGC